MKPLQLTLPLTAVALRRRLISLSLPLRAARGDPP